MASKYLGTEKWCRIDEITGEIIEVKEIDTFEKTISRNGFMITYLSEIICLIENLGNKKMLVVKYILNNMSKYENTLIITTPELSKKCGVSRQTVSETLKLLEEANLIKRRTGAIMLNPRLLNNKQAKGEAIMMTKFYGFED